jgi:hypothetical protein
MSDASTASETRDGGSGESSIPEKAQEMAGQAQDKAREAAGKAQEGLRGQVEQRSKQAGEQVSGTAEDLRSVGEELRKQGKDGPAKLADRAAEQAEKVGGYLTDNGPDELLHDVEDFGRKRPWALLLGGLVVGAAASRFLKASSRSRYQQRGSGPTTPTQRPAGAIPQSQPYPRPPASPAAPGTAVPARTPVAPAPTGTPVGGS